MAWYAELVANESLRRRVFDKIAYAYRCTIAMQKLPAGRDDLLSGPLNHLQVELLRATARATTTSWCNVAFC